MQVKAGVRRKRITLIAVLLAILVIAAGAIIVTTLTHTHVSLDDGTVWVTSIKDHKAARFNVKLQDANAALSPATTTFDVAQDGDNTVIVDGNKARNVLASTLGTQGTSDIKSSTTTMMNGPTVAFLNTATGNVWAGQSSDLGSVTPTTASPQMRLGNGGKVSVDADGAVYGYRPSDGMVLKMDNSHSGAHNLKSLTGGKPKHADSFTVVEGTPIIATQRTLIWQGGSAVTQAHTPMTLQAAPTDNKQQGWAAASASNGIFTVDFHHAGKATSYISTGTGNAAQPVSTGGCVSGAWSQEARNYIHVCSPTNTGKHSSKKNSSARFSTLQSITPTSQLVFRTNHRQVVLNDITNGNVWNPNQSPKTIKIQWKTLQTKTMSTRRNNDDAADNQTQFKPSCSAKSGEIKAQDDSFGARTNDEQILDVLRNDEQTDCSIISITKVGPVQGSGITVSPIYSGRYLQLDTTGAKVGQTSFTYEIDDGKGQTSQATVTLDIEGSSVNKAPQQSDTPPEYSVEQGASVSINALGGFTDPEGDPLTLVSANAQNSDQVALSTRADGQLIFNAGSVSGGRIGVEVTVSDGQTTGTGSIYFSVRPANTLPALIDAVAATCAPGTPTTVNLKPYVHGTSVQPPQLSDVRTPAGASISTNSTDLSFTFSSDTPGTYTVPYTISQGTVEAQGLARVNVKAANEASANPVAANDVALLGADRTAIVEPLNNDIDPLGGVLAITAVNADPNLGIKTGLVAHNRVYLTARQIPTKPVKVTYTVANASGSSQGTIVLQPPALTASNSAPKATNIAANVRASGIVSLDILDHVSHSDGTTITLDSKLQYDKRTFKGLAFVSGDSVRYQASGQEGVYPVTYTVRDNLGNAASGIITITVHAKNAETKAAPTPRDAQAQVAAGQKVRIPITMTGIDMDGDDDTLLGLGNKAPKLGRIDEVGANYMVYEAYNDSAGTDTFSYAVEDWTGQRAQAQIRVGIFTGSTSSGVYARDDQVTLRPNKQATVPVTLNDISGDNTDLKLSNTIEAQGIQGARVEDNSIAFSTPNTAGTSYIIYTVHDKAGFSDTATLTITCDPKAKIDPPTAYDYRVPSSATIDKQSVDVNLAEWIANPSGSADELQLGVDPSARDHAHVKGGKQSTTLSVDLTDEARSVPYTVTNTTYNITSTAFVQVPPYGVFPPTLRPKAPPLKVNAKQTLTINIADYVRVGAGKAPHIDKNSVSATKSANTDYFVNDQTLKFTAPRDYAGPASITFTVADGVRNSGKTEPKIDKNGNGKATIINSSTLTLPITVIGRNVPPPTFSSPTISVVAGEDAKTIDLTVLTHAPGGLDADEMQYTYSGGDSSGSVTAHLTNGGKLTIRASEDAPVGSITSIPISIKYTNGTVNAGVTAQVVQSTRPLAQLVPVHRQISAGSSENVDVLAGAFNPFPSKPLTVTDCKADDRSKITVNCGGSGSITIHAASDIGTSSNTVVVNVQDATHSRDRQVSGTITLSVIDKPDQPLLSPVAGSPADGAVNLSWTPGNANGSPITDYQVDWDNGSKTCGAVTTCTITGLTNGREYNFSVKAKNEVGWSKPSVSVSAKPDRVPTAPDDVSAEGGKNSLHVSWKQPRYVGTAPDSYTVSVPGVGTQNVTGTSADFHIDTGAIGDGSTFTATVRAHNRAGDGATSAPASGSPWGDPDKPQVSFSQNDNTMTITVHPGNLHNSGCSAITVTGDFSGDIPCGGGSLENGIKTDQYHKPQQITATLTPKKSGANPSSITTSVTPAYDIHTVTGLNVSLKDSMCTATWSGNGKVSSFIVNRTINQSETSYSYYLETPWTNCGTVYVTQKLNGASGPEVSYDARGLVYKKQAEINNVSMSWGSDSKHLMVNGNVQTWGQGKTTLTVIDPKGNRHVNDWPVANNTIDITEYADIPGTYTWLLNVVGDNALANSAGGTVQGTRPTAMRGSRPTLGTDQVPAVRRATAQECPPLPRLRPALP